DTGGGTAGRIAACTGLQRARHLRDGDFRTLGGRASSPGRNPSIHSARCPAFHGSFPRSLAAQSRAARGIGSVAEPDRLLRGPCGAAYTRQRSPLRALLRALASAAAPDRDTAPAIRPLPPAIACPPRTLARIG